VRSRSPFTLALAVFLGLLARATAQPAGAPLTVTGLQPVGVRSSVTESHVTLEFTVWNPNAEGRLARVSAFYPERADVRYAREVWVPGRARVTSQLTIGPVPARDGPAPALSRELKFVLSDRTDGTERVVLPKTDERERSRVVLYRKREVRDPVYALFADSIPGVPGEREPEVPPEVVELARLPRAAGDLSEYVSLCSEAPLALVPEALEGIDVAIIAGDRLAADPPGLAALRRWVEGGGRVWVMLDRTDADTIAPLIGDPVPVVERVGLTEVALMGLNETAPRERRTFEVPVPHARAVPAATDRVLVTNGNWPAAFVRRVGRGKVLFTTLGGAAWALPLKRNEKSPFARVANFPKWDPTVLALLTELTPPEPDGFPPETFAPLLLDDVGYSVLGRGPALAVLGAFLVALAVGFAVLRRARRPVLVGSAILGSAAVACLILVVLGERARRSVPPAVGVAALVEVVPGTEGATATGAHAVFNSASGPVEFGTTEAARLSLDTNGLDGQILTRLETDAGAWKWDRLALPAGARTGTFRAAVPAPGTRALARFGPNGLEGRFAAGPFSGASDAVLSPQSREPLAVRFGADGTFAVTSADALPPGEFLTGPLLSDKQQRRQSVYRQLHGGKGLSHQEGRDLLFAWTDPLDPPLLRAAGARVVGGALLAVPMEFERTPPGTRVLVPRGLVPFRRVTEGPIQLAAVLASSREVNMRLRFQLPPAVVPFEVERATLSVQARAPFRRLTIGGVRDGRTVPAFADAAPVEAFRVDLTDPALLRTDATGGLLIDVAVGPATGGPPETTWKIESLALEVVGRTADSK
jgi:hypothetical protein